MELMELKVIKTNQAGKEFYLGKMPAALLIDSKRCKSDIWAPDRKEGYQRRTTPAREISFAKYISESNRASPVPIILSIRDKVRFKGSDTDIGTLYFSGDSILWQVDGQHRIGGLKRLIDNQKQFADLEVPVIIITPSQWAEGKEKIVFEEALQFYTINKTQKGVRSDLAARFLIKIKDEEGLIEKLPAQITRAIEWMPKAIGIAEIMNSKGIWKGNIIAPNSSRRGKLISEGSFADSLRPVVTNESLNLQSLDAEVLAEYLNRYWKAISDLCPEAFKDPHDYVIQKITGAYVLHALMVSVLAILAAEKQKKVTAKAFKKILSEIPEINSKFWHSQGEAGIRGTNRKAFKLLQEKLEKSIKKIRKKESTVPFEL